MHGHQLCLAALQLFLFEQSVKFCFDILTRQLAAQEPHQHVRAHWWPVAEERWREGLHDEQVLSHLRTGQADLRAWCAMMSFGGAQCSDIQICFSGRTGRVHHMHLSGCKRFTRFLICFS